MDQLLPTDIIAFEKGNNCERRKTCEKVDICCFLLQFYSIGWEKSSLDLLYPVIIYVNKLLNATKRAKG